MARPNRINANQFRADQQDKLTKSGIITKLAGSAIARLDNALQAAIEDDLPVGTEITRTYVSLVAGDALPNGEKATAALETLVLSAVKQAITDDFGRRGFSVVFQDVVSAAGATHYVTIS
jgi:hypothetical protein